MSTEPKSPEVSACLKEYADALATVKEAIAQREKSNLEYDALIDLKASIGMKAYGRLVAICGKEQAHRYDMDLAFAGPIQKADEP